MTINRLYSFAIQDGDVPAIVDAEEAVWSRRQIAEKSNRLARALRAAGCRPGHVLSILAPNGVDFIVLYLAATQIGMYVVPVNWHLATGEIRHILEDSGTTALFVDARFKLMTESALQGLSLPPSTRITNADSFPGFSQLDEIIARFSGDPIPDPVQGRVLSYTSATTGKPKGVLLPLADAERVLDLAINARIAAGTLPEQHVLLCGSMLYHGAPLEAAIVSLHMGHKVVLMALPDAQSTLRLIDRYRITIAYLVPSMFPKLLSLHEEARAGYSTASLRKVLHVGVACPIDVKRRMIEWWGPVFLEAYGATEGAGTAANSHDWLRFPGTVGKAMPGTLLRILDADGNDVPAGSIGTIYLTRYSGDRFEYLNDPEKTSNAYRGDYFTVGDLGYLNPEGFLFLCGRSIDVINMGGTKVYPAEIEELLIQHPDVADCAVTGVPDSRLGESIMAVVCPRTPDWDATHLQRTLVRWLSTRLSIFKMPTRFAFARGLPRSPTGKMDKKALQDLAAH